MIIMIINNKQQAKSMNCPFIDFFKQNFFSFFSHKTNKYKTQIQIDINKHNHKY